MLATYFLLFFSGHPPTRGKGAGAAPALVRQLISMAMAEQEHRSLIEERDAEFRIRTALQARVAEVKVLFDREVERRAYHSIYSLLVAEL